MRTKFCIIIDDQQDAIDHLLELVAAVGYVEVLATFTQEEDARKYLHVNQVDFIILDVELSKINAFQFLATLANPKIPTILYTAFEQYEDRGYDYDVVDVLLKPVSRSRFFAALRRMNKELERLLPIQRDTLDDCYYYFQIKGPMRFARQLVWFKDIVYIDMCGRQLCIHLVGGKMICSNESFKRVLDTLPVKWFKQCFQNIVFNVNFYQGYVAGRVVLTELKKTKGSNGKDEGWEPKTLPVGGKALYPDCFDFFNSNLL